MKKTLRTLMMGMMALLACNALISCSNDDEPQVAQQEGKTGYVEFTLTRGADTRLDYKFNETTKGLDVTWEEDDKVVVEYETKTGTETETEKIIEVFDLVSGANTKTATFAKSDSELAGKSGDIFITYAPGYTSETDPDTYFLNLSTQEGALNKLWKYDYFMFGADLINGKIKNPEFESLLSILHFPKGLDFGVTAGSADFVFGGGFKQLGPNAEADVKGKITIKSVRLTDGKLVDDIYVAIAANDPDAPPTSLKVGDNIFVLPKITDSGKIYTFEQENLKLSPVGKVIGSDGNYYANKAAAEAVEGVKAVAMIAYLGKVNDVCENGIAIALEDASTFVIGNKVKATVDEWASKNAVSFGTWRVPSVDDFKYMFEGCGGDDYKKELTSGMAFDYGSFRNKLIAADESANVDNASYWASTQYGNNFTWDYNFQAKKFYTSQTDNTSLHVRACLAF